MGHFTRRTYSCNQLRNEVVNRRKEIFLKEDTKQRSITLQSNCTGEGVGEATPLVRTALKVARLVLPSTEEPLLISGPH